MTYIINQKEIVRIKDQIIDMDFLLDYKYCDYETISGEKYLIPEKVKLRWDFNYIYIEMFNNTDYIKAILKILNFKNIEYVDDIYYLEKIQRLLVKKEKNKNTETYFNLQIKNKDSLSEKNSKEEIIVFGIKEFFSLEFKENIISNFDSKSKDIESIFKEYKEEVINDLAMYFEVRKIDINESHFKMAEILVF